MCPRDALSFPRNSWSLNVLMSFSSGWAVSHHGKPSPPGLRMLHQPHDSDRHAREWGEKITVQHGSFNVRGENCRVIRKKTEILHLRGPITAKTNTNESLPWLSEQSPDPLNAPRALKSSCIKFCRYWLNAGGEAHCIMWQIKEFYSFFKSLCQATHCVVVVSFIVRIFLVPSPNFEPFCAKFACSPCICGVLFSKGTPVPDSSKTCF